jgi:hypothetical protein
MMCIDSFNSLDAVSSYGNWVRSPYNLEHGGPCKTPPDFFTNPEAKRLFKQRLSYLVARWGYSTSVLAWELWNEVDLTTGYDSKAVAAWHKEMALYLRSIDPWRHPITTSYARTEGDPEVDGLPQMEFLQSHNYGARDVANMVSEWSRRESERYRKSYYLGEYGADMEADREGVQLHNGLWAGMLSGCPGTPMLWYWYWVEAEDLYREFSPAAAFAADVDWVAENYRPVEVVGLRYAGGAKPEGYGTLEVDPAGESWDDAPTPYHQPSRLRARDTGEVDNQAALGRYLYGTVNHVEWHNPVTFEADYPQAGRFEVIVGQVSPFGGARIVIFVDGRQELSQELPASPGGADAVYGVAIPPGKHEIKVENEGQDWFRASYRLVGYLTVPNLRVLALGNAHSALAWVQNREHTCWHVARREVTPVHAAEFTLAGLTPGRYQVEQWDTANGTVVKRETVASEDGTVTLETPDGMSSDVAYKVRPAG